MFEFTTGWHSCLAPQQWYLVLALFWLSYGYLVFGYERRPQLSVRDSDQYFAWCCQRFFFLTAAHKSLSGMSCSFPFSSREIQPWWCPLVVAWQSFQFCWISQQFLPDKTISTSKLFPFYFPLSEVFGFSPLAAPNLHALRANNQCHCIPGYLAKGTIYQLLEELLKQGYWNHRL